jgi:hypothetical protein
VLNVRSELADRMLIFGRRHLRHMLDEYGLDTRPGDAGTAAARYAHRAPNPILAVPSHGSHAEPSWPV